MTAPHASSQRRSMIGKLHVAKNQLAMAEDDYRALLQRSAGVMSAAEADIAGLDRALKAMEGLGWKALPPTRRKSGKSSSTRRPADHPVARKARALWISLWQLGAIDNASEQALEAFAKRQLGCTALQWADQSQCDRLIEALKAIAIRHGWKATGSIAVLKRDLCRAILARLVEIGHVPAQWSLKDAMFRLFGEEDFRELDVEHLTRAAGELGRMLREHQPSKGAAA